MLIILFLCVRIVVLIFLIVLVLIIIGLALFIFLVFFIFECVCQVRQFPARLGEGLVLIEVCKIPSLVNVPKKFSVKHHDPVEAAVGGLLD